MTQIDGAVLSIAISAAFKLDQTCFAASLAGLYRSDDSGQTWRPMVQSEERVAIMAVAISPDYLSDRAVFAGLRGGVMRSWNGGETWTASILPPPPPTVTTVVLSPSYAKNSTLFAGTDADGVFRSGDRGVSWESWNFGLLDRSVLSMVVSPAHDDELLFVGTPSGLFRSRNGGRAWREVDLPSGSTSILCLAISPDFANDGLLYAGTESHGLLVSKHGQQWSSIGADVLKGSINVITLSPHFPAEPDILVATEHGLYISHDYGDSWALWAASTGIMALAAPHDLSGRTPILAGLADGGVQFITMSNRNNDHLLKHRSETMADANSTNRRTPHGTADAAQDLVVDGLPTCTIHAAEDGIWHVVAQLADEEQAALAAAAPSPDALCKRAQHALGLAGIGSRIERERNAIGVYAAPLRLPSGEATLVLDGHAVLWSVGHATSEAIHALVDAATQAMRQSHDR